MRVAVLHGGPSEERAVSLASGRAVVRALEARGHEVWAVVVDRPGDVDAARGADVAFLALHGKFGEDGTVQERLEGLGVAYTGTGVLASRDALDKVRTRELLGAAGLRVPAGTVIRRGERFRRTEKKALGLGLPVVLKPSREGSSIGVHIVEDMDGLREAFRASFSFDGAVLCERKVTGREMTVGILFDRALPPIEILPRRTFFDYGAKYDPATGTAYRVNPPVAPSERRRLLLAAERAHRALGCRGLSRVDLFLEPDGFPTILEVNTIPGFTATSLLPKAAGAMGFSFEDLCEALLELALESKATSPHPGRSRRPGSARKASSQADVGPVATPPSPGRSRRPGSARKASSQGPVAP